jgi:hypothetical protein
MSNNKLKHQTIGFPNIMIKMLLINNVLIMDNAFKHTKAKN